MRNEIKIKYYQILYMTTASNKAELVQLIRDWINTDTEIRAMNKELRD
jgi:hypothetical protein